MSLGKSASLILLGLLTLSSVVIVDTGDVAVVYRFGAVDRTLDAGLGLRAPWPIERHEIVDVSEVRRAEPGPRRMLTGDTNLVVWTSSSSTVWLIRSPSSWGWRRPRRR